MSGETITKDAIIKAFKKLMFQKPFDKISISDITNSCDLNRQTFYYHFQDKYDLMNYLYYQEIFLPLVDNLNENNYQIKFKDMFETMLKEKVIYQNAISMNGEYGFKQYLYSILKELIILLIPNKKDQDIKFYTFGLMGVIVDWVSDGMKITPLQLATWMNKLIIDLKRMS